MDGGPGLRCCRVLVVEDDWFIAQDTTEALRRIGCHVVGPVPSVADAEALVAVDMFDAALLDIETTDGTTFDLARQLTAAGMPVVFFSHRTGLPFDLRAAPLLSKWRGVDAAIAVLLATVGASSDAWRLRVAPLTRERC